MQMAWNSVLFSLSGSPILFVKITIHNGKWYFILPTHCSLVPILQNGEYRHFQMPFIFQVTDLYNFDSYLISTSQKICFPQSWNMQRLCIVSLICGFNPYIFTFKGNTCPTNHCYFHFNRQCIQILIRIRCCELPVHIKQKNNEHPDYIRRTVTKDI